MQIQLEQFVDRVFRFALSLSRDRHVAEELTQDCFLRARQRKGQLQNEASARSWLFKIVINLWRDRLKKKQLDMDSDIDEFQCRHPQPGHALEQSEQSQQIVALMQSLPSRQRSVLHLSAIEQLSNHEIATLLKIKENAVKASLSIARKTMRGLIRKNMKQDIGS